MQKHKKHAAAGGRDGAAAPRGGPRRDARGRRAARRGAPGPRGAARDQVLRHLAPPLPQAGHARHPGGLGDLHRRLRLLTCSASDDGHRRAAAPAARPWRHRGRQLARAALRAAARAVQPPAPVGSEQQPVRLSDAACRCRPTDRRALWWCAAHSSNAAHSSPPCISRPSFLPELTSGQPRHGCHGRIGRRMARGVGAWSRAITPTSREPLVSRRMSPDAPNSHCLPSTACCRSDTHLYETGQAVSVHAERLRRPSWRP